MANNLRDSMEAALKSIVIPELRRLGFRGSFPHFRRPTSEFVELWTFQFDRNGGGFVVEIACGSIDGFTTHWGKHIPANKLSAHDLHPNDRTRIQPKQGSGTDVWFRYDDGDVNRVAYRLLEQLPIAESWWREQTHSN